MTKRTEGFNMPNGEFRYMDSKDNLDWYNEGRADQRHADLIVGLACLFALALFVVLVE